MSQKRKQTKPPSPPGDQAASTEATPWRVSYLPEADRDFQALDSGQRLLERKAIAKVAQNPLPSQEGGYGKALGGALTGFLKIKLKSAGLRVVYKLVRTDDGMLVVVIGARADDEVYDIAMARAQKHRL